MGAVETEGRGDDFWARMRTSGNQKAPDSKARVQYLLDEIALLRLRFDNNQQPRLSGDGNTILSAGLRTQGTPASFDIFGDETRAAGDVPTSGETTDHEQQKFVIQQDDQSSSAEVVKELYAENVFSCTNMEAVCEDFLQFSEERLRTLIEESSGFYENAEKELRLGKVDRLELTKLLQREKPRLQRHRSELDELKTKIKLEQSESATTARLSNAVQEVIDKLAKLLDERESLQLKFEVQVELGHYFRLLKLLELQKARDDFSRRNIEKNVQELRDALDQARQERDVHSELESSSGSNVDVRQDSGDSVSEEESGSVKVVAHKETEMVVATEDGQLDDEQVKAKVDGDGQDSHKHKDVKREIMKLMSEQERKWKAQLEELHEMERRLALSELENRRLSDILKDRQSYRSKGEVESVTCAGALPLGYSSIYFSPIFQERRQSVKAQRDEKDEEIERLKSEISSLKRSLQEVATARESDSFLDRVEVPAEEKTIPVDACSNREELSTISSLLGLDLLSSSSIGDDKEDDKQFATTALRKASVIFQQHRDKVLALGSSNKPRVQAYVDRFRSLSLQIRQLSECLESECNLNITATGEEDTDSLRIAELEAQVERVKSDMVRAAEEHARELDRKEKTLAYAQELNLRLANDMSNVENALADMRVQSMELQVTSQAKLDDCKHEAEVEARALRQDILSLENGLNEKDRVIQDLTNRVQACQRETDAVAQEKHDVLKRLQSVTQEMENHRLQILELKNEVAQGKEDGQLEELQAARKELQSLTEAYQSLENRYCELQSKLLETEYELSQREAALERLTLHLAASTFLEHQADLSSTESLRSKHQKRERARKSIQEVEEKMAIMAEEMSRAKEEMEEMKSQSFELLQRLKGST